MEVFFEILKNPQSYIWHAESETGLDVEIAVSKYNVYTGDLTALINVLNKADKIVSPNVRTRIKSLKTKGLTPSDRVLYEMQPSISIQEFVTHINEYKHYGAKYNSEQRELLNAFLRLSDITCSGVPGSGKKMLIGDFIAAMPHRKITLFTDGKYAEPINTDLLIATVPIPENAQYKQLVQFTTGAAQYNLTTSYRINRSVAAYIKWCSDIDIKSDISGCAPTMLITEDVQGTLNAVLTRLDNNALVVDAANADISAYASAFDIYKNVIILNFDAHATHAAQIVHNATCAAIDRVIFINGPSLHAMHKKDNILQYMRILGIPE